MTKITESHYPKATSTSIRGSAFNIVYIAYSEVNAMSGSKEQNGSGEGGDREANKQYASMGRIAKIPLVGSTASAISNLYSSVKQSHCVVQTMFENVEEGWSKSAAVVSPVTTKIEETLEGPLRVIDNAACVSLDFIEEKISSVKLPPEQIYVKSKDYLSQRVLGPVADFTSTTFENFREIISHYARSVRVQDVKDNDSCSKNTDHVAENNK